MGYERDGLLHEQFSRQAKATPDNIAIVAGNGRRMTYKEVDSVTDDLATNLRFKGVVPDSIVGIYMERRLEYALCYIAVLKAGGAYLPIDVSYPPPLLDDIMTDVNPIAVFVCTDLLPNLSAEMCISPKADIVINGFELQLTTEEVTNRIVVKEGWLEEIKEENARQTDTLPPLNMSLDNLAYTVYSSGTTGKPKGIQCPHEGAVFSYHWRYEMYPYAPDDREACNVFFVWEMLRPLLKGLPLYIVPDNTIYDPRQLCEFLLTNVITRILFTPSLLEAVLDGDTSDLQKAFRSLRIIIFCGEVVTTGLLERCIKTFPWIRYVNLYSVSEAHDVTCCDLTDWYEREKGDMKSKKFCPVGKLLPGVQVVVLNDSLELQPLGVSGEIYVGGPTLARGYLNRPELNAERFICTPDILVEKVGTRLYRTGDWGYMLSDGSFEICGRCDTMVKIRGYSIETQAVESVLLDLPMVNACVVMVMGDEGHDRFLVAYIVPEGKVRKKDIRAELKKRLPFYMIPSYFMLLSNIPIVPTSGKLDRSKLPPIEISCDTDQEGVPTTPTENALVPLWCDVLRLKTIDVQESFFDLGGHSLLASKLLTKVAEKFRVELSVTNLFVHSTVSAMARLLDSKLNQNVGGDAVVLEPTLDLAKEVKMHDQNVLSMDIQLRAFWRSMLYHSERWNSGRVLITGSTGFLGAFLLRDLLLLTRTHIFCLVRELPDQDGMSRIRSTLSTYGLLAPAGTEPSDSQRHLEAELGSRAAAVKGDVGLVNMGMSQEDYMYMCTEVDYIIHAAAYVNLIYPYQALHGPNVLGTQNVILFACSSKIKPLHYISTDAVFPSGLTNCDENEDMAQYASRLTGGYSQSKWVAEQLVHRAMDRGLPAAIYRLGNLSGESKEGHWNPQDFTLLLLQTCLRCRSAPAVDWLVEMTPVDFVSNLIVSMSRSMALALGKVFHVTNSKPIKSDWLFEWISAHGYPLQMATFEDWKTCVKECSATSSSAFTRLLETMVRDASFFSRMSTYRNDNLTKILKLRKLSYPQIDNELLRTYFHHLARRDVFPKPHKNIFVERPLEAKVAIVTGASSGIGAMIAKHLASAGAMVAMGARRTDRLVELKRQIEADGGVAIAVTCDVTDRSQVQDMVQHTECTLGPVDILVNNAGLMYYTCMKNFQEDEWHRQVDVNCKGTLNCIGALLPKMLGRKKGHIVNMSSDAGRMGFAGLAVYSGTKFFIEGLSRGMRAELANSGIRITCIQPGDVRTELLSRSTDQEAKAQFADGSETKILETEDVARAVVYAVSQPEYVAINEILIEPRQAPIS